jgi:hypothetical protein
VIEFVNSTAMARSVLATETFEARSDIPPAGRNCKASKAVPRTIVEAAAPAS